jgi:hypothetical protein
MPCGDRWVEAERHGNVMEASRTGGVVQLLSAAMRLVGRPGRGLKICCCRDWVSRPGPESFHSPAGDGPGWAVFRRGVPQLEATLEARVRLASNRTPSSW